MFVHAHTRNIIRMLEHISETEITITKEKSNRSTSGMVTVTLTFPVCNKCITLLMLHAGTIKSLTSFKFRAIFQKFT